MHSVPLDQVVFDTFQGGFVRLSGISDGAIEALRDAIQPVYSPRYEGPDGGSWLGGDDLVIGFEGESEAFAYPIKFLNFHEIVNDEIDGVPIVVTYCPLCGSGVVFDRRLNGEALLFGNTSALYQSDLVMFDHQTGSFWFQTGGEAIVGTLTGERLTPLPSVTMPWTNWLSLHPRTRVLSREQGFGRAPDYTFDFFEGYGQRLDDLQFLFPVETDKLDSRLRPSAIVLAVGAGGVEKAYPLEALQDAAVNDEIGGRPVLVLSRRIGTFGRAFSREVDGRVLTFEVQDEEVVDRETGSRWDFGGRAVEGPLEGVELESLPTRRSFWFSLGFAVPDIEI